MSDTDAVAPAGSFVSRETPQAAVFEDAFSSVLRIDGNVTSEAEQRVEALMSLIESSADALVFVPETLGAFLLDLSTRSDILLNLKAPTLERFVAQCRQCCRADEIASNLSQIATDLCRIDAAIIAPLFEFLACNLPFEPLNAAYVSAIDALEDAQVHSTRLAQSMQRFGQEALLRRLLVDLSRTRSDWLRKPSMLRCFQQLLSSISLPAITSEVGEKIVSGIASLMKATDQFRAAVLSSDRSLALKILSDNRDEFDKVDFLRWMNSLRSLTSRLGGMAIPVSALKIEGDRRLEHRKIAAIIFSDRDEIEAMRKSGDLAARNDLNAAALGLVGDHTMLNEIVSAKFTASPFSPMTIEGGSASEVFRNAASSVPSVEAVDGPRVSVIMSAYNPDPELMEIALQSFARQTLRDVELFIVDDGSEADSASTIARLAAKHRNVTLIRVNENSGPYVGRNRAIEQSTGDFIAIQDADDWSHPQRLAAQVDYLLRDASARVVTTEHIRIGRTGRVSLEGQFETFGDGPMTSMFRAEIFKDIGGFAAVRSRGDLEMRERIARYYGPQANAILPLPMALCLADAQSLSNSMSMQKAQHLQLWRTNISKRPSMINLFRAGIPLRAAHQTPVPMMLRPHAAGQC